MPPEEATDTEVERAEAESWFTEEKAGWGGGRWAARRADVGR